MQLVSSPNEVVDARKCDTQVTTLVIGELCAHTFCSTTMPDFAGYDDARLCRISGLARGWRKSRFNLATLPLSIVIAGGAPLRAE